MNRAFDQVVMDVGLHKAGVTFILDRAGVTGPDGASHNGVWDLAMLQIVPGIKIAAPRDAQQLRELLAEAIVIEDAPTVIRYPKGTINEPLKALRREADGVDVLLEGVSRDVLFLGVGPMARVAMEASHLLEAQGISCTVIDPRWVVPVAHSVLEHARDHRIVITIEDGIKVGGIGTRVRQDLRAAGIDTAVTELGIPDEFLEHASRDQILADAGLTAERIAHDVAEQVAGERIPRAREIEGQH
jgi:1-deoxy-D-xylulose-5-phosphate synthase